MEDKKQADAPVSYQADKLNLTETVMNRESGTIEFRLTGTDAHTEPLKVALEKQFGTGDRVEMKVEAVQGKRDKDRVFTLLYRAPDKTLGSEQVLQDAPRMRGALKEVDIHGTYNIVEPAFKALTTDTSFKTRNASYAGAVERVSGQRDDGSKERQ